MTYLDTGCLVKLYYPEPDSPQVIALVQGRPLFFTPLHELEMTNALQLKVFSKSATAAQAAAARALVAADLQSGVLVTTEGQWKEAFAEAVKLAEQHSGTLAAARSTCCTAPPRKFWPPRNSSARTDGKSSLRPRWV